MRAKGGRPGESRRAGMYACAFLITPATGSSRTTRHASIRQDGLGRTRHTVRMSRRFLILAFAMFFASSVAAASSGGGARVGLWKAQRWLKPHLRSTLIIQRSGGAYTADLAGRVIAVTVQ